MGDVMSPPTNSDWPMTVQTSWLVGLNGSLRPSCQGQMNVTLSRASAEANIAARGSWFCSEDSSECLWITTYQDASWKCLVYQGDVQGTIVPSSGNASLVLGTTPGYAITVTGTATTSSIVGSAMFSDAAEPFQAVLQ